MTEHQDPGLSRTEARALRRMVDELRAEPVPELDWSAVERGLDAALSARAAVYQPAPPPSGLARAFTFAAAAGFIAIGLGLAAHSPAGARATAPAAPRVVAAADVAAAPGEAGARGDHDLAALRAGDAVEAGDSPVTFARAGLVRWTLAPQGRVVVRSGVAGAPAQSHLVALERGSIRAEVTPRDPAEGLVESFAVEVGGTRVAVHGTAFTVTRSEAGLVVDVEHGTVAVGPIGHVGVTTGRILVGPARASFSLDGGRTARLLPRDEPVAAVAPELAAGGAVVAAAPALHEAPSAAAPSPHRAPAAAHDAPPAADHAEPAAEPAVAAPPAAEPAPAAPTAAFLTTAGIRAGLARCFAQTYAASSSSVEVRVSSTFTIKVNEDGTIQSARLDPPLKPEFGACAGGLIAGRFESGPDVITLPLSFQP